MFWVPHLILDFNPAAMGTFLFGYSPQTYGHGLLLGLTDLLKLKEAAHSSEGQRAG